MFKIIRTDDNEIRNVDGGTGRPIVPVLIGTSATVLVDGTAVAEVTPEETGPQRITHPQHGHAVIFGVEPPVLDKIMERLNPAAPLGRTRERAVRVLQALCNDDGRFNGTVDSLFGEPPLNLAAYGADAGNWTSHSMEQL